MQITPVTSASTTSSDPTTPTTTTKQKTLGQADFLKLLAVQFQQQDPMKPTDDTAFIAQMAQFTSLDQTGTLVQQMTQMRTQQDITTANSYIGRNVTLDGGNNQTVSGQVSGVDVSDGTPRLIVGQNTYPLSAVLLVEPGTTTANPTSTPPANAGGV
jgi:flagellar basal-body rod modification protein FlgD